MRTMQNRGLGVHLATWLQGLPPGRVFALDMAVAAARSKYPHANRMAVSNALSGLRGKGLVELSREFAGVQGTYRKPLKQGGMQALVDMGERKIIDDLLDAMAKAEPVLKKYARIIDAMNDAK